MLIVIYTAMWLLALLGLLIFGFLAGRFSRKLPAIDNALPWTLHWAKSCLIAADPRHQAISFRRRHRWLPGPSGTMP